LRSRSARRFSAAASVSLALLATAPGVSAAGPFAEPPLLDTRPEAPTTLFAVDAGSGDVELNVDGSWKGEVVAAGGVKLTELGAQASLDDTPLLFTQTIDLTLSLLILDRWLVEASFLDDYDLNTYRAAYLGAPGERVQYVGVGNTGLDFPAFPYADLSGATPNSFGAYAAFGGGDLTVHALLRYDSATREEKVYVGTRERTVTDVSLSARLKGRAFVLPDDGLDAVPVVYLEDSGGNLSGSDGRKYRRATASEASASASLGMVGLASTPTKRVAVAYSKSTSSPWVASLGSYASGNGFLGETQAAFEAVQAGIDLSRYPQSGGGNGAPAAISVGGTPALVVYEPGSFSPFELANRYGPPASAAADASADLVHSTSGAAIPGYSIEETSTDAFSLETDGEDDGTTTTSGRIFAVTKDDAPGRRSPAARFPLLELDPYAYLPGGKGSGSDAALRFVSYGGSGSYDIGTDVVAGSVVVTRSGLRDSFARFDPDSGTVTLSTPAGAGELVRISFLRNVQDRRFGSLAAGLGAVYTPDETFSARTALSLRWNVSGGAFTTSSESSPGTVMLSGGTAWNRENLQAELRGALYYENPDTTGLFRAAGMENAETELDFSVDDASEPEPPVEPLGPAVDTEELYEPYAASGEAGAVAPPSASNRSELVYRDYTDTDVLGNSVLKPIDWSGASVDSSKTGPYVVSDSSLGTAYVADYRLGEGETEQGTFALWAGFQMKLSDEAAGLSRAGQVIIPFRFYDLEGAGEVRAYLQIGALADDDGNSESAELVWSAPINATAASGSLYSQTSWEYAKIELTDEDRARLAEARSLRVVVRLVPGSGAATGGAAAGRLLLLPPIAQGAAFRPVVVTAAGKAETAGDEVVATAALDSSLRDAYKDEIDRLHPEGASQRVLEVSWTGLGTDVSAGADGYPSPFPLWAYRRLSFYIRGPEGAGPGDDPSGARVRIFVASNGSSADEAAAGDRFLDVSIPAALLAPGAWTRVEVDYAADRAVYLDGEKAAGAEVAYRSGKLDSYRKKAEKRGGPGGPQYLAAILVPAEGQSLGSGVFAVDEFALENPIASFGASAGSSAAWKLPGTVLAGPWKRPLLSDLELEGRSETGIAGMPLDDAGTAAGEGSAMMNGSAAATLLGARTSANIGLGTFAGTPRWNGGHSISAPIGPLTLTESFSVDPEGETLARKAGLSLSGPLSVSVGSALDAQSSRTARNWEAAASATTGGASRDDSDFLGWEGIDAKAAASVAYTAPTDDRVFERTYAEAWTGSGAELALDDGSDERRRALAAESAVDFKALPVGLSLEGNGRSRFSLADDSRASGADARIAFPVEIRSYSGSFDLVRAFSRTLEVAEPESSDADLRAFSVALEDSESLWARAPFGTLRSRGLVDEFRAATDGSLEANYSDGWEAGVALPRTVGPAAFIVPATVDLSLSRVLARSFDTIDDYVAAAGGATFSATNVFGAFGTNPAFDFYKDDEFGTELSARAKFPREGDVQWETALRQSARFFGFGGAELAVYNTLRFGPGSVSEGGAVTWTRRVERSALRALYRTAVSRAAGWERTPFLAELAEADEGAEARESAEFAITSAEDTAWSWNLKHESIVKAMERVTVTAWMSLGAAGGTSDGEELPASFAAKLGLSLSLIF
jgi:hypothetical protein